MQAVESGPETADSIGPFFDYLYGGLEGYVCSPTLDRNDPDASTNFRHHWFEWPTERDQLVSHVKTSTTSLEVYMTPAIWSAPKLTKDHFKATNVVWTEFDGNVPSTLGQIPNPTIRIESSGPGHEHFYWKLSEPLVEVTQVEAINRSLTYQLGADASAWDATQILRPPNTTNHKRSATTRLLSRVDSSVTPAQFGSLPSVPEPETNFSFDTIPNVTDVILKYPFPEQIIKLFTTKDFPVGQRSTAMMQLGYALAEMGLNDAEMFSVLRNADDRWGKFKDRRDRDRRLVDLIAKARLKHPQIIEISEETIPIFGLQSLLNTEAEISWVVPNLLQEKGYMLFTGPSGVGKTQFSLQMAIHMALGKSFLDYEFSRAFRLVFFSLEMGLEDVKYFLSIMAQELSEDELGTLEQNLLIIPLGEPLYLDNQNGQATFCNILDQVRPDGVFVDSLGSTTSTELSSESTVKTIMDFFDRVRRQYNVFTWHIHHHRKASSDNKKPNKLSDVYGNQYLVNRATSVYCLWPGAGVIDVIPLKKRLGPIEDSWQVMRSSTLNFTKKTKAFLGGTSHLSVVNYDFGNEDKPKKKINTSELLDGM